MIEPLLEEQTGIACGQSTPVIYARCRGQKSKIEFEIEAQVDRARSYCDHQGLGDPVVFCDRNEFGETDLPGFRAMLKQLELNPSSDLLVTSYDRLTRSFDRMAYVLTVLSTGRHRLHVVDAGGRQAEFHLPGHHPGSEKGA